MKNVFIKNLYFSISILSCLLIGDVLFLYVWYLAAFFKEFLPFMVGYNLFLILFYVVLILQRIQIDQDGITFFVIKHIFILSSALPDNSKLFQKPLCAFLAHIHSRQVAGIAFEPKTGAPCVDCRKGILV